MSAVPEGVSRAEMSPGAPSRRLFDRDAVQFLLGYLRSRWPALLLLTIAASAQSLLVVPVLALVRRAFDEAIPQGDARALVWIGVGILLVRAAGTALALILRALVLRTVKGAVTDMRRDLVARLFMLSRQHYDRVDVQALHTRIVQDSERVDNMSNTLLTGLLPALFASVVSIGLLLSLNWRLVMLAASVLPLLWLSGRLSGRMVKGRVRVFQRSFERFSSGVQFVLRHMDLTRLKGFEVAEQRRQQATLDELRATSERMAMSYAVHAQVQRTVTGIAGIVILVAGGIAVAQHSLTLGELLAFYVASGLLNGYVDTVLGSVPEVISGTESLATLRSFMLEGDPSPYTGTRPVVFDGGIEFDRVTFGYGERAVLRDVSLAIPRGANIAVVGVNGAGKSTLLHLLTGFYRPQSGELRANGVSYDELDMPTLRRAMGVVPQHPSFFSGSARANIGYGRENPRDDEIALALELSLAGVIIDRLPRGLDTEIGERGALLSGGEAQRLAIARALLGNPRLLVLDEPTTHLDVDTVQRLMRRIIDWPDRPTLITISHDPAVIELADVVYEVVDGGLRVIDPSTLTSTSAVSVWR